MTVSTASLAIDKVAADGWQVGKWQQCALWRHALYWLAWRCTILLTKGRKVGGRWMKIESMVIFLMARGHCLSSKLRDHSTIFHAVARFFSTAPEREIRFSC